MLKAVKEVLLKNEILLCAVQFTNVDSEEV